MACSNLVVLHGLMTTTAVFVIPNPLTTPSASASSTSTAGGGGGRGSGATMLLPLVELMDCAGVSNELVSLAVRVLSTQSESRKRDL